MKVATFIFLLRGLLVKTFPYCGQIKRGLVRELWHNLKRMRRNPSKVSVGSLCGSRTEDRDARGATVSGCRVLAVHTPPV